VTTPNSADIEAARLLFARLGISAAGLLATAGTKSATPTFAEYIPRVSAAVGTGTRRVYTSYWNRLIKHWGSRHLDEPTPTEIHQLGETIKATLTIRRNARGGRSATEHLIAALRCIYRHAENDGLITPGTNPALKVAKPRRLPSPRQAIPDKQLDEINTVVATTGNDPALDTLILRLHQETACRRGGALALTPNGLGDGQILRGSEVSETRWPPYSAARKIR
jgi:integrase/recombinase XerC